MTTIGQDEAAQAMAERDPLPQEVSIGETMARRCSTAALLAVLSERGFEAAPAAVGAAVSRVIDKARALEQEDATRWTTAQALFHDAVRTLLTTLCETDAERTPETVLRAMVNAYARAATDAEADVLRLAPHTASTAIQSRMFKAQEAEANMRAAAATYLAEGEILPWLHTATDYQQRLSGARDLNAPPLE